MAGILERDQADRGRASPTSRSTRRPIASAARGARTPIPGSRATCRRTSTRTRSRPTPTGATSSRRATRSRPTSSGSPRSTASSAASASATRSRAASSSTVAGTSRPPTGTDDEVDVVIAATGVLHHPRYPDIEGLDTFAGARVPQRALGPRRRRSTAQRVGIIGTGSTAVQIVGAIVDEVEHLSLFQRTAQWIAAAGQPGVHRRGEGRLPRHPEQLQRAARQPRRRRSACSPTRSSTRSRRRCSWIEDACLHATSRRTSTTPSCASGCAPTTAPRCKRLIISPHFYDAIQRPNAELVTEAIERIEPEGVRTEDGVLHELDVLVLATGFHADAFMRPMEVIGRDGATLDDAWADAAERLPVDLDPGLPELLHAQRPERTGRQLLAHRGRRAAVRLHHAARRAAAESASAARSARPTTRWTSSRRRASRRPRTRSGSPAVAAGTSTTAASRRRGRGRSTGSAPRWPHPISARTSCGSESPCDAARLGTRGRGVPRRARCVPRRARAARGDRAGHGPRVGRRRHPRLGARLAGRALRPRLARPREPPRARRPQRDRRADPRVLRRARRPWHHALAALPGPRDRRAEPARVRHRAAARARARGAPRRHRVVHRDERARRGLRPRVDAHPGRSSTATTSW